MSETLKRFLSIAAPDVAPSKGELVVVPTTQQLLADAQRHHEEAERAAQTSVEKAIAAGKDLIAAKLATPHGLFADVVAAHCKFSLGTAQKYMRFARKEPQLLELIRQKLSVGLHLSMPEAQKFLNKLTAEDKPKPIRRKTTPAS
jgi:hypothetical protein